MTDTTRVRDVYVEEVAHLLESGESAHEIARHLDRTPGAIARGLYRAGRPDLARPFEQLRRTTRIRRCACGRKAGPHSTRCRECFRTAYVPTRARVGGRFAPDAARWAS